MVLVVDKKPFEGSWWKYGLGVFALQVVLIALTSFKLNGEFDIIHSIRSGYIAYIGFAVFGFLPFAAARLGFGILYWFALAGYVLGVAAYFLLASLEPIRRLSGELPYIGFVQLAAACVMLGALAEFGRYVYRKVSA